MYLSTEEFRDDIYKLFLRNLRQRLVSDLSNTVDFI